VKEFYIFNKTANKCFWKTCLEEKVIIWYKTAKIPQ